jgi:hypothetical protein
LSVALREEPGLRVFANTALRRIFGPEREKATGGWRRLHSGESQNLHASPNIIRVIKSRSVRLARHVTRMGEIRNAYIIFVGKPEGKRSLGRPRSRWEDNIRMFLGKWGGEVWIGCMWLRVGTSDRLL